MAHPLAAKAISAARVKTTPSTPRPWRICCALTCWPRPGSPHPRPGRPAGRSAPALGWSAWRSRVQSQLHALLADLGIIPELTTLFGPAGRRWLAELQLPASARGRLDAGLRLIDAITMEVTHADADLRAGFAGDPRVRRLLPIPGIGLVTAATVSPRSGTSSGSARRSGCAPGPG
jgi:hypothetical protein